MSEPVACDRCKAVGRRRIGSIAPEGWLYATVTDEMRGDVWYLYACSSACARLVWHRGPARLDDPDQPCATIHGPTEAAQLRTALERIDEAARSAKAGNLRMGELIALIDMAIGQTEVA